MNIHLFIDTNVYLNFYHYSNDDLEELSKLLVLLDNDKLTLYLPEQVVHEYERNREVKLADALKSFGQIKLDNQFPKFCKGYAEYDKLKKIIKDYNQVKQSLLKNVKLAIDRNSLSADKLIEFLFSKADYFETNEGLVKKARFRFDVGNPPGKDKSYGDAINWETLLEHVEEENNLYFIADDKDWNSNLDNSKFNNYLGKEWKRKKRATIKYYKTLSDFFKDVFPDIKIATELEKEILIAQLVDSGNFYSSRKTLQKLSKFEVFTTEQVNQYISASIDNSQIRWISSDEDINEYLYDIATKYKEQIEPELLNEFYNTIPIISTVPVLPPPPPSI